MRGQIAIDHRLQEAVDTNEVPGVVAIAATSDRILYEGAFGSADAANDVVMQTNAIFEIMSMTKPVTSLAVMLLYEEGRFDLDDPISRYLPSLANPEVLLQVDEEDGSFTTRPARREITIRHLLANTSGFGYGFSNRTLYLLEQKTGKTSPGTPAAPRSWRKVDVRTQYAHLGRSGREALGLAYRCISIEPGSLSRWAWRIPAIVCLVSSTRAGLASSAESMACSTNRPNPTYTSRLSLAIMGCCQRQATMSHSCNSFSMADAARDVRVVSQELVNMMASNQIGDLVVETQPGADRALSRAFPLGAGKDKFGLGFQIATANGSSSNGRSPGSCSWSGLRNTHFWVDLNRGIAGVILMQVLPFYDEACIKLCRDFEECVYGHLIDADGEVRTEGEDRKST